MPGVLFMDQASLSYYGVRLDFALISPVDISYQVFPTDEA
jgi:hypothetical protein